MAQSKIMFRSVAREKSLSRRYSVGGRGARDAGAQIKIGAESE